MFPRYKVFSHATSRRRTLPHRRFLSHALLSIDPVPYPAWGLLRSRSFWPNSFRIAFAFITAPPLQFSVPFEALATPPSSFTTYCQLATTACLIYPLIHINFRLTYNHQHQSSQSPALYTRVMCVQCVFVVSNSTTLIWRFSPNINALFFS